MVWPLIPFIPPAVVVMFVHIEPADATGQHQDPANGTAIITSETRLPAIHCSRTSSASWHWTVAVKASECRRTLL
jgi:hypothetical protein